MQNFLAVLFFAILLAAAFWPDEIIRPGVNNSVFKAGVNEMNRNTNIKERTQTLSGTGMLYHYSGINQGEQQSD